MPVAAKEDATMGGKPQLPLQALEAMAIPMLMLTGPVGGWFVGEWIDKRWDLAPWGASIGVLFGLVVGIHQSIIILRKLTPPKQKKPSEDGDE